MRMPDRVLLPARGMTLPRRGPSFRAQSRTEASPVVRTWVGLGVVRRGWLMLGGFARRRACGRGREGAVRSGAECGEAARVVAGGGGFLSPAADPGAGG